MTDQACLTPGAVSADDLMAFLDRNASQPLVDHVRSCAHCRAEARSLERTQASFRAELHRFDCPSPQDLGEYELGLIALDQRQQVAAHVVGCPRCQDELATLRGFLAADRAPASRAARDPITRIAELLTPRIRPALAGLRGSDDDAALTFRAGEVTITIEAAPGTRPGRRSLVGLVLGEKEDLDLEKSREIQLVQADRPVSTTEIDDLGNFSFDDVPAGRYELRLFLTDGSIVIEDLRIDP